MEKALGVLDRYVSTLPSPQEAVKLYPGQWTSALPPIHGQPIDSGTVPLFNDGRISWAIDQVDGVSGSRVLELGPLEGGHTYMLHNAGAAEIVAVEANSLCFTRCLVVKEIYELVRAKFLLGDCQAYLQKQAEAGVKFDLCVASGILYHMTEPHRLIERIASVSDAVYLWTQFYDHDTIANRPDLTYRYSDAIELEGTHGNYTGYHHAYGEALNKTTAFIGGSSEHSVWMPLEEIERALADHGLSDITHHKVDYDHPNGPCVSLLAKSPA